MKNQLVGNSDRFGAKHQDQNLSPVEEAYLQTINALEKTAKKVK